MNLATSEVTPTYRNVMIERVKDGDLVEYSHLDTPAAAYDRPIWCKVLKVGPGEWLTSKVFVKPEGIKAGDYVSVRQFEGHKPDITNDRIRIVNIKAIEMRRKKPPALRVG